jgi:NCAIR mutase (PurE)-related protein
LGGRHRADAQHRRVVRGEAGGVVIAAAGTADLPVGEVKRYFGVGQNRLLIEI